MSDTELLILMIYSLYSIEVSIYRMAAASTGASFASGYGMYADDRAKQAETRLASLKESHTHTGEIGHEQSLIEEGRIVGGSVFRSESSDGTSIEDAYTLAEEAMTIAFQGGPVLSAGGRFVFLNFTHDYFWRRVSSKNQYVKVVHLFYEDPCRNIDCILYQSHLYLCLGYG